MSTEGYRDNSPPPIEATYKLEVLINFERNNTVSFYYSPVKNSDRESFLEKTRKSFSEFFEKKNEEMFYVCNTFVNMNHVRTIEFKWIKCKDANGHEY